MHLLPVGHEGHKHLQPHLSTQRSARARSAAPRRNIRAFSDALETSVTSTLTRKEMTMVAINFQKRFAHAIQHGTKLQTIRPGADRIKVGNELQLFTGQRMAGCRRLATGICTEVTPIKFDKNFMEINGQVIRDPEQLDDFARLDGFSNWSSMLDFFRQTYGKVDFEGSIIKWTLAEAARAAA